MPYLRQASLALAAVFLIICTPVSSLSEGAQPSHQLTEITIQHLGCYGSCPIFTAVFRRDDTASYEGFKNVQPLGKRTAIVDFARLADWTSSQIGEGDQKLYAPLTVDASRWKICLKTNNSTRSIETRSISVLPLRLFGVVMFFDGVVANTNWQPVK